MQLMKKNMLRMAVCATAFMAGCGESDGDDHDGVTMEGDHDSATMEGSHDADGATEESASTPTGSTCPSDNDLTYDTFGATFMENYCTRCHSSELTGASRNEAPAGHDFDSLEGVLAVVEHVDGYAAAGPDAQNDVMPPDGDKPSLEERMQLGQWLACEVEAAAGN
jgi:uncharacterized membrane protein